MNDILRQKLKQIADLSPGDLGDLACQWDIGPAALKPLILGELSSREQLYFTFGLNMSPERLAQERGVLGAQRVGVAKLNNFQLCFDLKPSQLSPSRSMAVANIKPELGSTVWGILYWLPSEQMSLFSQQEVKKGYQMHFEAVESLHLGSFNAFFYMARTRGGVEQAPTEEYQRDLTLAAQDQGLPAAYVQWLRLKLKGLSGVT